MLLRITEIQVWKAVFFLTDLEFLAMSIDFRLLDKTVSLPPDSSVSVLLGFFDL
jgi:hypothetical protein